MASDGVADARSRQRTVTAPPICTAKPSAVLSAATMVRTASTPPSSSGAASASPATGFSSGSVGSSVFWFSSSDPSFADSPSGFSASSSSPSSMVSGICFSKASVSLSSSSFSGGAMAASLASYSAKESANAAEGSVGANGLKPSMVARRFIAALRTSAALSPSRPMPRSATTSQCDSGIAFFSAIMDHVWSTRARVKALTS